MQGTEGVYVLMSGPGFIFFTGLVSLLLGVLVATGGLVMLFRARSGGVVTVIFGLPAGVAVAINIAMVLSKMQRVSPGPGLWAFAGAAVVALALGITGIAVG